MAGPGTVKAAIPDSMFYYKPGTTKSLPDHGNPPEQILTSISVAKGNLMVAVNPNESWIIELLELNGKRLANFAGKGTGVAGSIDKNIARGFVAAKLVVSKCKTNTRMINCSTQQFRK
jgi:hypothetical protein